LLGKLLRGWIKVIRKGKRKGGIGRLVFILIRLGWGSRLMLRPALLVLKIKIMMSNLMPFLIRRLSTFLNPLKAANNHLIHNPKYNISKKPKVNSKSQEVSFPTSQIVDRKV
jgi:hypothetical protein